MNYTLTPSADGTFITIKTKGDITRQSAMKMNLEAHALGQKLNIRRYLVDVTESRNTDSVANNYDFAYTDMTQTGQFDRSAIVANLVSPHDHSHDFVETVARNAGLHVRMFTDPKEAMQFLMDGDLPRT